MSAQEHVKVHRQAWRRALRFTAAGSLLLALLSAVPASAAACPGASTSGRWTKTALALPSQEVGSLPHYPPPSTLSDYLAVTSRPSLLLANGASLYRSTDLGCSWTAVYTLDSVKAVGTTGSVPPDAANRYISHVFVAGAASPAGERVYATLVAKSGNGYAPMYFISSADDGLTWRLTSPVNDDKYGTPFKETNSTGYMGDVAIGSPINQDQIYLRSSDLMGSSNGGANLRRTGEFERYFPFWTVNRETGALWGYGATRDLGRSDDEGRTLRIVKSPGVANPGGLAEVSGLDVVPNSGRSGRLALTMREGKGEIWEDSYFRSQDNGTSWDALPAAPVMENRGGLMGGSPPTPVRCLLKRCSSVVALAHAKDEGSAYATLAIFNPQGAFWRSYIRRFDGRRWTLEVPPTSLFDGKPTLWGLKPVDVTRKRFVSVAQTEGRLSIVLYRAA